MKNRRYSSTAVEFPIRTTVNPHKQSVSRNFSTHTGARTHEKKESGETNNKTHSTKPNHHTIQTNTPTKPATNTLGLATLALGRVLTHPLAMRHPTQPKPTQPNQTITPSKPTHQPNQQPRYARRLSRPKGRSAQRKRPQGRTSFVGCRMVLRYPTAGRGLAQPNRPLRPLPAITGARALSGLSAPDPENPLAA